MTERDAKGIGAVVLELSVEHMRQAIKVAMNDHAGEMQRILDAEVDRFLADGFRAEMERQARLLVPQVFQNVAAQVIESAVRGALWDDDLRERMRAVALEAMRRGLDKET